MITGNAAGQFFTEVQVIGGGCVYIGNQFIQPNPGQPRKADTSKFIYTMPAASVDEAVAREKIKYAENLDKYNQQKNHWTKICIYDPLAKNERLRDLYKEVEASVHYGTLIQKDQEACSLFYADLKDNLATATERLQSGYYKPAGKPAARKRTVRLRPGFSRTCKG